MKSAPRSKSARLICHLLALILLGVGLCLLAPALDPARTNARSADAFERYRADRARSRAETRQMLERLADEPDVGTAANESLLRFCAQTRAKTALEGALALKGFEGALVYVGHNLVNIFLRAERLSAAQSTQILALALEMTGHPAHDIRIVPVP